ncbi:MULTISPECIES: flagellar export protein FliJ [Thermoanaerobacterium]|uniref:Flagellar FliJ protein n=2 Tax=Thermoanaerobacterium TaxID=28895 RepID=W9EBJ7_9THEO|nr:MULTISPECIES: flagellar export protein FliJ [Thermoanaerobacterium]AFK86791.1 flagellar export protein FliJ [Thermoanaerobacterium saccharolyticum JW/SL-YS485]ETO38591.1 flagellar export protein FliJ [Thermoanaerobacterium aotearoense SCUT27]
MKKFRYALETVLNIKEQKQKMEKEKMAILISKYEVQKSKLVEILNRIEKTTKENEENKALGTSAMNLRQFNLYIESLYEKYNQQKAILKEIEEEIEKERHNLMEVSKEKEALESLKEKKYEEYKYQTLIEQNLMIDEQISYKTARSTLGG